MARGRPNPTAASGRDAVALQSPGPCRGGASRRDFPGAVAAFAFHRVARSIHFGDDQELLLISGDHGSGESGGGCRTESSPLLAAAWAV
jgi:hypothetical protein